MSYAISSTLRECQYIYFECVPRNASEINISKMNFQPKDGKLVRLIFPFYIQVMQILHNSTLICAAKDTPWFPLDSPSSYDITRTPMFSIHVAWSN